MRGGDHLLRDDGDQPGQLSEPSRRTRSNSRVATVGRIQPHMEAKIIDTDGRYVPRGETGELSRAATP